MYSENDPKEVKDFMKDLGFPSNEESSVFDNVLKTFTGKEVVITKGPFKIIGTLHSATMIWGSYLNLTKVNEEETTKQVLEELHYYHPRDYKPELEKRFPCFVSAAFTSEPDPKDPKEDDLLVVPVDGSTLTCEGFTVNFPEPEEENEEE